MAKVLRQICLDDHAIVDGDDRLDLKRGQEYITSYPHNGTVTVFASYWARGVPQALFAGANDLHSGRRVMHTPNDSITTLKTFNVSGWLALPV